MIIEPKKSYKQTVKRSYKITRAVLSSPAETKGNTDLLMTLSGTSIIACTLSAAHPQVALDLEFSAGESIALHSRGSDQSSIHLTGYILEGTPAAAPAQNGKAAKSENSKQKHRDLQKLLEKTMSDEDSDDMDYSALLDDYGSDEEQDEEVDDEEDDDDNDMGDDDSDNEEGDEEEDDDDDDSNDDDEEDDDEEEEEEEEAKPPPSKKKKDNAKQPQPQQKKDAKKEQKPEKKEAAQTNGAAVGKVSNLPGGVKVKDSKEGTGAFAKPGKNVLVYYEGRVQGKNQIFDSCKQGSGFKFMLGRGTVIKGWDVGVSVSWIERQSTLSVLIRLCFPIFSSPGRWNARGRQTANHLPTERGLRSPWNAPSHPPERDARIRRGAEERSLGI